MVPAIIWGIAAVIWWFVAGMNLGDRCGSKFLGITSLIQAALATALPIIYARGL